MDNYCNIIAANECQQILAKSAGLSISDHVGIKSVESAYQGVGTNGFDAVTMVSLPTSPFACTKERLYCYWSFCYLERDQLKD